MKYKNKVFFEIFPLEDKDNYQLVLDGLEAIGYNVIYETKSNNSWFIRNGKDGNAFFTCDILDDDYINCGRNVELFLALAAMSDETDYLNLYTYENDVHYLNQGYYIKKGDLSICLTDYYKLNTYDRNEFLSRTHKSTIDEIRNYLLKYPETHFYSDVIRALKESKSKIDSKLKEKEENGETEIAQG